MAELTSYLSSTLAPLLHQLRLRNGVAAHTLGANATLTARSANVLLIDPGGSARTVTLPAEADSGGLAFALLNTGSGAEDLTIADDGATTVATATPGDGVIVACDGTSWYRVAGTPGDYGVRRTVVTVSAAEVLALNAAPKSLIPAPGAGKYIELVSAFVWLDFGSAAYAGIAAGEDLEFRYTDGAGQEVASFEATGFLDATADEYALAVPAASSVGIPAFVQPVPNAALVLTISAGEVTTGDSPLVIEVLYRIRSANPA